MKNKDKKQINARQIWTVISAVLSVIAAVAIAYWCLALSPLVLSVHILTFPEQAITCLTAAVLGFVLFGILNPDKNDSKLSYRICQIICTR